MVEKYTEMYEKIQQNLKANIDNSLSDPILAKIIDCHLFGESYEDWIECLDDRNEYQLYSRALDEYNCGILFLSCGLYKQSFVSLRCFLEQTIFGINLSMNEFNFKKWERGKQDLKFSEIIDSKNGALTDDFAEIYYPDLEEKMAELRGIIGFLYRELSGHVHGDLKSAKMLPETYCFNSVCFDDIIEKINSLNYVINMIFFIRYINELNDSQINSLESNIKGAIGTNLVIEEFYDRRQEE